MDSPSVNSGRVSSTGSGNTGSGALEKEGVFSGVVTGTEAGAGDGGGLSGRTTI